MRAALRERPQPTHQVQPRAMQSVIPSQSANNFRGREPLAATTGGEHAGRDALDWIGQATLTPHSRLVRGRIENSTNANLLPVL